MLFAVAVLLAAVTVWLRTEADNRSSEAARASAEADRLTAAANRITEKVDAGNDALTDPAATAEMTALLTTAIEATFSYDHLDLEATADAVDEHLVGKARCEYDLLFKVLKEQAPAQQSVVATTVRDIALVRLEGDRAEALVFIDQSSTRADVNNSVSVGAQFGVRAQKQGDQWKITQFNMFGQPLADGKPVPEC